MTETTQTVMDPPQGIALARTRKTLKLSQEQMAKLLGASFVSVNRWERGRTKPSRSVLELYAAIDKALEAKHSSEAIVRASHAERPQFLAQLYSMAYASEAARELTSEAQRLGLGYEIRPRAPAPARASKKKRSRPY